MAESAKAHKAFIGEMGEITKITLRNTKLVKAGTARLQRLATLPMKDDEEAIRRLFASWKRASQDNDVDGLSKLITDDAIFLAPGQPPIRGRAAFEALYRQVLGAFTLEQEWVFEEIAVLGDWGYCWGRAFDPPPARRRFLGRGSRHQQYGARVPAGYPARGFRS